MLVSHVMLPLDKFPVLKQNEIFKVCLDEMCRYRLGIACIADESGRLQGVFTDGDLRRTLLKTQKPIASLYVDDVLEHGTLSPLYVLPSDSLSSAIKVMELHHVWDLPVLDSSSKLVGLLHLHPVVKALMPSYTL